MEAASGSIAPVNGSTRNSQSYGTTPALRSFSAGLSSWTVKYSTGYARPGAGPHTGPATRNGAPGGSGARMVDLPVAGSTTPTPWSAMSPIKPWVRPAVSGVGDFTAAGPPLLQEAIKIATTDPKIRFRSSEFRTKLPMLRVKAQVRYVGEGRNLL